MNMHKETVTLILTKDLKMKATYAKMVTENHNGHKETMVKTTLKRSPLESH
jgi:hypothetical protein